MATGLSNSSLPPHGQLPPIPVDQQSVQGATATHNVAAPVAATADSKIDAEPGTALSTEATIERASKKESSGALNVLKKIGGGLLKGGRVLGAVVLGIVGYTAGAVVVSVLWMLSQFIPLPKPDEEKMRNNKPGAKEILNAFREGAMGMYLNALGSGLEKLAGWKDKKEPAIEIKAAPKETKTEWVKGDKEGLNPQSTGVKRTKDSEEDDQVEDDIPLETMNHSENRGGIGAHRARRDSIDESDDDDLDELPKAVRADGVEDRGGIGAHRARRESIDEVSEEDDDNLSISSETSEVDGGDSRSARSSVSETFFDEQWDED